MAGAFVGVGSIAVIIGGVMKNDLVMISFGMTPLSTMLAFFVGEKNGARST